MSHLVKRPKSSIPPYVQESAKKAEKLSLTWASLIARIYEVNPLICQCGNEIKITHFVVHKEDIRHLLNRIGWPQEVFNFDPPNDFPEIDICQLQPWTEDGFPSEDFQTTGETGPDPPLPENYVDPPHWEDYSDPPHWED